jgi:hypothetical protein
VPFLSIGVMDRSSHLSVILDLCPTQWLLSAQPSNPHPLSFDTFLSHLLVFLNSHIACKHENSLAVFGALPGKRSAASLLPIPLLKAQIAQRTFLLFRGGRRSFDDGSCPARFKLVSCLQNGRSIPRPTYLPGVRYSRSTGH